VVNDVVESMARMVDGLDVRTPRGSLSAFNWRMTPYSGGSDHMMFLDRRVPAVMFSHEPDYTHHTSEDTPDKVDPVELERCEMIATCTLWYLANLTSAQAADLTSLAVGRSLERLGDAYRAARKLFEGKQGEALAAGFVEARLALDEALARETYSVSSVLFFDDMAGLRDDLNIARRDLAGRARDALSEGLFRTLMVVRDAPAGTPEDLPPAPPRDARVPRRTTRGPLDFGLPPSRLTGERAAWYSGPEGARLNGDVRFELVNFADGVRTLSDIRDAVSAEFGPLAVASVVRFFEDLESLGLVRMR
jgi:hypothetical protein